MKFIPKAATYPPMFRAVTSAKKRKRLMMLRCHYGTSKPSSDLPAKLSPYDSNMKTTSGDGFLPELWKTVSMATDLINNLTLLFSKSKQPPVEEPNKSEEESKSPPSLASSRTPWSESPEEAAPKENMEQSFFEWLAGTDAKSKRGKEASAEERKIEKSKKPLISRSSLQQRSRFLVSSLSEASSSGSRLLRLEEVCKHLLLYPEQKSVMCKAGLVRTALSLKRDSSDEAVQAQARTALALVGCPEPPRGDGIRILSIDGGGTRNIMAIEALRHLESVSGRPVHQLFDLMCGVSSGAILAMLLGGLRRSLDECEELYRGLSHSIFTRSALWGTGRLVWSHAYYDTTAWAAVLKKTFGETLTIDTAKDPTSPKIAAVSAIMNLPHLEAFVFRNYDFAPHVQSYYRGSCRYRMWEAIRASGAAPGYFEEVCLDELLHQDGGIMLNNPCALAIHEARLLWPRERIKCVLSLGSGRHIPPTLPNFTSTSLKTKVLKTIDSATDTEAVHVVLNDLLSPDTYFRVNPYLTEFLALDENRQEKLDQMQRDAQMYLRRNSLKVASAANALTAPRPPLSRARDWVADILPSFL